MTLRTRKIRKSVLDKMSDFAKIKTVNFPCDIFLDIRRFFYIYGLIANSDIRRLLIKDELLKCFKEI